VFAFVSALALWGVRPAVRRHLEHSGADAQIGMAAIEGSTALVLERVDSDHGMIKIEGELWTARAYDAREVFEPGERVRVIEVKGATAMVWRE
jgi:membrane protein implicated in regulation of membrane protease activity